VAKQGIGDSGTTAIFQWGPKYKGHSLFYYTGGHPLFYYTWNF